MLIDTGQVDILTAEDIDKLFESVETSGLKTSALRFRRYIQENNVGARENCLIEFEGQVNELRLIYRRLIMANGRMKGGEEQFVNVSYIVGGNVLVERLTRGQILEIRGDYINGVNIINRRMDLNINGGSVEQTNRLIIVCNAIVVIIEALNRAKEEYLRLKRGFNSGIPYQLRFLDGTEPLLQRLSEYYLLGQLTIEDYRKAIEESYSNYYWSGYE